MPMNPWKVATLALAAGIVVVVGTGIGEAPEADASSPAQKPQKEAISAIGILESANRQLWRAPRDDEGHRAKSMAALKAAIGELRPLAFPLPPVEPEQSKKGKKK